MESFTATITPENNDVMGQSRKTESAARDARTLVDVVSVLHKNNHKANLTTIVNLRLQQSMFLNIDCCKLKLPFYCFKVNDTNSSLCFFIFDPDGIDAYYVW